MPVDTVTLLCPAVPRTAVVVLVDGAVLTAVGDDPIPPLEDVRLAPTLSEPV